MNEHRLRNRYFFGLGTIGRDMFYTIVSMFILVYLTEVVNLSDEMLAWAGGILFILGIFDALNDPIMGTIVDNTRSRWGKYKPWILIGAVTSAVFMVLLFTDLGLQSTGFIVFLGIIYIAWDITYGLNDIGYWSMLPAISLDQKEREKTGSFARVCANIGLFAVVAGIIPVTNALSGAAGGLKQSWFLAAVAIGVLMIGFQLFTLFGVKEQRGTFKQEEKTTLRGMFKAIFKNSQLLFAVIAMGLFMIGYTTTTKLGPYFFKYAYGDENMFSLFAIVLGVAQIGALLLYHFLNKHVTRKRLYFIATLMVVAGYILIFFSPMNMIFIGIAGVLIFAGEALIQILMLMFLADTIEYGQWKFGKRNQAVTLSVQPFINKIGGAIATGVTTLTLILSGINEADKDPTKIANITSEGLVILKIAMFVLPLILIIAGYLVYRFNYKIDKALYDKIVSDLAARGDIKESE